MPQGKFKKTKLPDAIKKKQQKKSGSGVGKAGAAFTRRSRAPIQAKKSKFTDQDKLKQVISRTVNKSAEDELRSLAKESKLKLSKAQEAVKKHHEDLPKKDDSVKMETI